ncbi:MAG: F0F1 ATP synthase subunit A [Lactovum sp.]
MAENIWTFNIGPIAFDGTLSIMTILTVLIVFLLVFWASRNMEIIPKGKQNVLEWVLDFISGVSKESLGEREATRFALFNFALFSFVVMANEIGLVTKLDSPEGVSLWRSPTSNPIVTLILALTVVVFANLVGVKKFGIKEYIKNSFLSPPAFMLPLNLLEEFTNVLSLGLRLYGNLFAGEIMLNLIASVAHGSAFTYPVAIFLAMIWIAFSLFIGALQGFVFVMLSNVYFSKKIITEN